MGFTVLKSGLAISAFSAVMEDAAGAEAGDRVGVGSLPSPKVGERLSDFLMSALAKAMRLLGDGVLESSSVGKLATLR